MRIPSTLLRRIAAEVCPLAGRASPAPTRVLIADGIARASDGVAFASLDLTAEMGAGHGPMFLRPDDLRRLAGFDEDAVASVTARQVAFEVGSRRINVANAACDSLEMPATPSFEPVRAIAVDARAAAHVALAVSHDSRSGILDGVLCAGRRLVATDTMRMHVLSLDGARGESEDDPADGRVLHPRVLSLGGDIEIGDRFARAERDGLSIVAANRAGNYPDWRRVHRVSGDITSLPVAELARAVTEARRYATSERVEVRPEGACLVVASRAEVSGAYRAYVPIPGPILMRALCLNGRFLAEALAACGDEADLRFESSDRPVRIEGASGMSAILMPMAEAA